jgi:spermidine synthase
VLALFAVSGFVSLALEVAWFRASILLIRPTVYAFGIMLATVLGGIALGSALAARLARACRDRVALLVALEILVAAAAALSPWGLVAAPEAARAAQPWLERVMPAYLPFLVTASVLTIAPTAVLLGAAFPIGAALWTGTARPDDAGSRVGLFYALNVCGGILGSLAAGFFLLPALGSGGTIALLSTIVAAAVCPLALLHRTPRSLAFAAVGAPAVLLAALLAPDPTHTLLEHRFRGETILWLDEGKQSTVSVHASGGSRRSLYVDGTHQASTWGAMPFVHQRIGHLAMALHPEPRTALVVGLGGGATAGAVSLHPGVEVDVVELSEGVVRAARFFRDINFDVLDRPNVRLRVDDGRNFLMLAPRKYDVITADVILPIHAGAANLYSAEYFRLVRDALDDDGVALQWVAGTEQEFRLIVRTFMSVFPETTLWADGSLMVGTKRPLRLRRGDFEWRLRLPPLDRELPKFGLGSFADLLKQFRGGAAELRALVGPGPLLTDDRPVVEYFLALPRGQPMDLSPLRGDVRPYVADVR